MIRLYGTLGPACAAPETLSAMLRCGMTGVRLNLSHTMLREAEASLRSLREAAAQTGTQPELLIDLQGPEVRIGALAAPVMLREGETVTMGDTIPVPEAALEALQPNRQVLLDDGKLLLQMLTNREAKVLRGGLLQSRKSLAVPGAELHLPPLTDADLENLRAAPSGGVTAVMQPFVRGAADLIAVRRALDACGGEKIRILAKIENRTGMAHLQEILPQADEIVIARGDLGNAMPLWDLPAAQMQIASACRAAGKPFLVVTQLLASMEHAAVPTRAEVSDIFHAVLDGATSLMLTGETAVGEYPIEAMRYLANTVKAAEAYQNA